MNRAHIYTKSTGCWLPWLGSAGGLVARLDGSAVQICWLECGLEQPMVDAIYVDRSRMFHILDKLADTIGQLHGNTWGYPFSSAVKSKNAKCILAWNNSHRRQGTRLNPRYYI